MAASPLPGFGPRGEDGGVSLRLTPFINHLAVEAVASSHAERGNFADLDQAVQGGTMDVQISTYFRHRHHWRIPRWDFLAHGCHGANLLTPIKKWQKP
jgi:hypothetical protein